MAEENRKVVIELQNVKRYFQVGSETVKALRGVSFKIYEGEFVTIQGTSGSGKSTLLNQARLSGHADQRGVFPGWSLSPYDVEDPASPST